MTNSKHVNRRSFLKSAFLAGGGLILHFNWPFAAAAEENNPLETGDVELNSYIKINKDGQIILFNPNPEFGQNVKTSMPMMLAEELDVDWEKIKVEQADFYPQRFGRQFTGGSQSIRGAWKPLRTAGATARQLLILAAAQSWKVPSEEITTNNGMLIHAPRNRKASYGEMASLAASIAVPENVKLKLISAFKIIGTSKSNVEIDNIITGKPLFTSDYKVDGMRYAMIIHPPAFGLELKSYDDEEAKTMPGITDIFSINTLPDDQDKNFFDTTSFRKLIVVVGNSTWEVLQAKKAVKVIWEAMPERKSLFGGNLLTIPAGLESSEQQYAQMDAFSKKPGKIERRDGNPEEAFKNATKILERTYTAPFLAHNTMEPVNCFAHVKGDQVDLFGPIQAPEFISGTIALRLKVPKENVHIRLARMGGGFGRRAYGHHLVEAAVISQKLQAPVRLIYTREDEMTAGIYRPMYSATFRAALDANNQLIAYHVKAGGIPESPLHANRFPAGAIDNYLAESWFVPSNITIGAFRAPRSNFMGASEQSFFDELAFEMDLDPIQLRLNLLKRAKENPVGKNNDYDASRYAAVIELVRDQSQWEQTPSNINRGMAAYFCHNTYAAEVVDLVVENNIPKVKKVVAAMDCGVVINVNSAKNMCEGAIIDGIGNSLFGELPFKNGQAQKDNFNTYRLIRANEIPKEIDIHFVDNGADPTGLGEPPFPPIFAAVANALFKATGKRFYNQPFIHEFNAQKS